MELPRERVSSTPSPRHVPRAVAGTGGYRYRSNTKLIEWWHRAKKTARESVNPFQRYKLLKSVMGSGRVGSGWVGSGRVGSGRAYWDFCLKLQKNSLRASRSARNNIWNKSREASARCKMHIKYQGAMLSGPVLPHMRLRFNVPIYSSCLPKEQC